MDITHVARDRYRDRDRWRDTGVKCYIGTLVTILVCTVSNDITYHVQIANYKAPAVLNWKQLKE